MLSVMNGTCHLLATTWEWKEDIDADRARDAKRRAEENTLEQLLAAKISFERFVRQKRAQVAMRCL